jgi:hypothetical protein
LKDKKLELLCIAHGYLDAQIKNLVLKSNNIESFLYEESLGTVFGFTNTSLGEVEIYVKAEDYKKSVSLFNDLNEDKSESISS